MTFWFKYYERCFSSHVYETTDFSIQSTVCEAISLLVQDETTMKVTEWGDIKTSQENYLWRNQRVMRRSSPAVLTK